MPSFVVRQTVFSGKLPALPNTVLKPASVPALADPAGKPLVYSILTQSRFDLADPDNAPSVSMWGYLLATAQTERLNEISIYVASGTEAEQMRFLYMNDAALTVWTEMKKPITVIGRLHRPPQRALLSFGMPFSE